MFFWHGKKKAHLVCAAQPGPGAGATFCCLPCWLLACSRTGVTGAPLRELLHLIYTPKVKGTRVISPNLLCLLGWIVA